MADWINFRLLKQKVSIIEVLNHYRIMMKPSGPGYWRGACPLPQHSSDSRGASFMVNVNKNVWACHSQSCIEARHGAIGGNILDFVCLMEGCSLRRAGLLIQNWAQPITRARQVGHFRSDPAKVNSQLGFRLGPIQFDHPYLKRRCVDPSVAERFGIGFYTGVGSMHGRVIIPIHNDRGSLVAYAGRAVDALEPRYRFPAGFHKAAELYNLHRARAAGSDDLIVVEGFFDCLRVYEAGFRNVVALMGCAISGQQIRLLSDSCSGVVLLLDGDSAGRQATPVISAALLAGGLRVRTLRVPDGQQPDSMSIADLRTLIGSTA